MMGVCFIAPVQVHCVDPEPPGPECSGEGLGESLQYTYHGVARSFLLVTQSPLHSMNSRSEKK